MITLTEQIMKESAAIEQVIRRGVVAPPTGTAEYLAWRHRTLVELGLRSPLVPEPGSPSAAQLRAQAAMLVRELAAQVRAMQASESIVVASMLDRHAAVLGSKLVEVLTAGPVIR